MEEDYILDRFNLTGLNTEVQNYTQALDLITDNFGMCRTYDRAHLLLTEGLQMMKSLMSTEVR